MIQSESGSPTLSHRFGQPFESVFGLPDSENFSGSQFQSAMSRGDVYPAVFKFLVSDNHLSLEEASRGENLLQRLRFRDLVHRAEVLVHESFGGGLGSSNLLPFLNLNPRIQDLIQQAHSLIPADSVALHFRYSDYKADKATLFQAIERLISRTIVLATDSKVILEEVRLRYPEAQILSIPELLALSWHRASLVERAVVEMFAIAGCKDFLPMRLDGADARLPAYSGYTRLSKHIWAVGHIRNYGWASWFRSISPADGIGGFKSSFLNLLYVLLVGLPRLANQNRKTKGCLSQGLRRLPSE